MKKILLTLATLMMVSQFSLASSAEPNIRQAPTRPMAPPRGGSIPQVQLTPDFLYKQITALQQQVANLQGQVNALRSVVQVTPQGATIQAEHLTLKGIKNLAMTSLKTVQLTAADNLALTSGKTLSLQGGQDVTAEGAGKIKLKAPQIKLNDGTKSVARVTSSVSGGKVVSGSTSVFVP
jgi:hypothetical protein